MIKPQHFIIPLVVYPFDVLVSINEDDSNINEYLLDLDIKQEDIDIIIGLHETVRARVLMVSTNQTIMRFNRMESVIDQMPIIAHEIFHAATFIMDRIGMKLQVEVSDEAYAYLIQYLTSEVIKNIEL